MAIPSGFQTPRPTSLRSASSARGSPSTTRSSFSTSSARSSSSFARRLPVPTAAKEVAKCLAYEDDLNSPTASSTLPPEGVPEGLDDDLAPLLELPDPNDASPSTVISAVQDDAVVGSVDAGVIDVEAPAKPSQRPASARSASAARSSNFSSARKLPVRTAIPRDLSSRSTVVAEGLAVPAVAPADAGISEIGVILAELQGSEGLSPRSKRLLIALVEVAAAELIATATSRRLRRAAFWGKVRIWVLAMTVATVATIDVVLAVALFVRRGNDDDILPPT